MVGPPRKQSIPVSALPIAVLVLMLVAGAIAVLSFALSRMQAPQEAQETGIDTIRRHVRSRMPGLHFPRL